MEEERSAALYVLVLLLEVLHVDPLIEDSHGYETHLQQIDISALPDLLTERCVLLAVPPYPSDIDLESLLLELAYVYRDEPSVFVGQFSYNSNSSNNLLPSDHILWRKPTQNRVHLAFYEREPKDRTCLLSPPQTVFYAQQYTGQLNIAVLVQYVNEKCNVFRTPHGNLTPEGLFHHHLMNNLYVPEQPVEECMELNEIPSKFEFWNSFLFRSRPVVIKNAYKESTPKKKWSNLYLRQLYGQKRIHIKLTEDGIFEGVESARLWSGYHDDHIPPAVKSQLSFPDLVVVRPATSEMLFSDFLDLISSGNLSYSAYLEYSSIPYYMPELEGDVEELPFVKGQLTRRHLNMWLSDGNTLGKLHFDPYDNFLCQLSGEKHLTLFDPHHNENLYEAHIPEARLTFDPKTRIFSRKSLLESTSMVMSPVDIAEPNMGKFPKYSKVHRVHCKLEPGDLLFMPAFWWHEVQSYPDPIENRNLAINFWYEPLYTKEFPCPSCQLTYNMFYKHILQMQTNFEGR